MKSIIKTSKSEITPKYNNEHGQYEYNKYEVTDSSEKYEVASPKEGNQTIVAFYEIMPGKSNYPFHYHTTVEEVFYIISGSGILEASDGKHHIKAGDVIICPVGQGGAHKLINTSKTENLVYLDVDTNNTPDIAYYPHSNKVGIRAVGGVRDNFRLCDKVEYYDNEP